jgi:hypothetical protein
MSVFNDSLSSLISELGSIEAQFRVIHPTCRAPMCMSRLVDVLNDEQEELNKKRNPSGMDIPL